MFTVNQTIKNIDNRGDYHITSSRNGFVGVVTAVPQQGDNITVKIVKINQEFADYLGQEFPVYAQHFEPFTEFEEGDEVRVLKEVGGRENYDYTPYFDDNTAIVRVVTSGGNVGLKVDREKFGPMAHPVCEGDGGGGWWMPKKYLSLVTPRHPIGDECTRMFQIGDRVVYTDNRNIRGTVIEHMPRNYYKVRMDIPSYSYGGDDRRICETREGYLSACDKPDSSDLIAVGDCFMFRRCDLRRMDIPYNSSLKYLEVLELSTDSPRIQCKLHCWNGCAVSMFFSTVDIIEHGYRVHKAGTDVYETRCAECGELLEVTDDTNRAYGRPVCDHCFDTCYVQCADCGDIVAIRDSYEVENVDGEHVKVCSDCINAYSYCDRCDMFYPTRTTEFHTVVISDDDTAEWCEWCTDDHAVTCGRCGTLYDEELDGCPNCAGDEDGIHEYHWGHHFTRVFHLLDEEGKPHVYKNGVEYLPGGGLGGNVDNLGDDNLFYGIELEMDNDETEDYDEAQGYARDIQYERGITGYPFEVYCERDGSLTSGGVESITEPCTLAYYLGTPLLSRMCEVAKNHDLRSHNTNNCGLHVHISRHIFAAKGIGKDDYEAAFTYAVNHFEKAWSRIARRNDSHYYAYLNGKEGDVASVQDAKVKKNDCDRYQAVNLQNRNTVELRIFKGTLKLSTLQATLWLVDALCRTILEKKGDIDKMTLGALLRVSEAPDYVKDYLSDRGLNDIEGLL